MGIIEWLRKQTKENKRQDTLLCEDKTDFQIFSENRDHIDLISSAENNYASGNIIQADNYFLEGIKKCRERQDSLDYALGRYGDFLRGQSRFTEAKQILREAIDLNTDIPRVWEDYVGILAQLRDLDNLFKYVDLMISRFPKKNDNPYSTRTAWLLNLACRKVKANDSNFAVDVARRAMNEATASGDQVGRWAASGELGHILERTEKIDEAVNIWTETFEEGSNDPVTVNRLSLYFKNQKKWENACYILNNALKRGLRANVEEELRKRLAYCEAKLDPKKKKQDIPAFSIRYGADNYNLVYQLRILPPIENFHIVGSTAICIGSFKSALFIVDVDLMNGDEIKRVEGLPELGDLFYDESNRTLGVKRTAAVGQGPTYLYFMNEKREVINNAKLDSATSDVVNIGNLWCVGCRDGYLYAFDKIGNLRWKWETPGSLGYEGDPYLRPCPYMLSAFKDHVFVGSMDNIYAINLSGKVIWHTQIPDKRETKFTFSTPDISFLPISESYEILKISSDSSPADIKSAYRRMALETHPDRNPNDPRASDKFLRVQTAYEQILTRKDDIFQFSEIKGDFEVTANIAGPKYILNFLITNENGLIAGSSYGIIYKIEWNGIITEGRVLGNSSIVGYPGPDGTLALVWCDDTLFFLNGSEVVNIMDYPEPPTGMKNLDSNLLIWDRKTIQIVDRKGHKQWVVEFSRQIDKVEVYENKIVCAVGVLAVFNRSK